MLITNTRHTHIRTIAAVTDNNVQICCTNKSRNLYEEMMTEYLKSIQYTRTISF